MQNSSQQVPTSEGVPSQPTGSAVVPTAIQHQPASLATGQQTKFGKQYGGA